MKIAVMGVWHRDYIICCSFLSRPWAFGLRGVLEELLGLHFYISECTDTVFRRFYPVERCSGAREKMEAGAKKFSPTVPIKGWVLPLFLLFFFSLPTNFFSPPTKLLLQKSF